MQSAYKKLYVQTKRDLTQRGNAGTASFYYSIQLQ
jgi:hypothetical protein